LEGPPGARRATAGGVAKIETALVRQTRTARSRLSRSRLSSLPASHQQPPAGRHAISCAIDPPQARP
jgi:hypothetical protein